MAYDELFYANKGSVYLNAPFSQVILSNTSDNVVLYTNKLSLTKSIALNTDEGTAGQVLTSGGAGAAAVWAATPGGFWLRDGSGFLYPETAGDNLGDPTSFISQIYAVDMFSSTFALYYSGVSHYTLGLTSATSVEMPIRNLTIGDKAACKLVLAGTDNNGIYTSYIYPDSSNANANVYIWAKGSGKVLLYGGSVEVSDDFYPDTDVTLQCGTAGFQWLAVYTRKLYCSTESTARLRLPVGTDMYG